MSFWVQLDAEYSVKFANPLQKFLRRKNQLTAPNTSHGHIWLGPRRVSSNVNCRICAKLADHPDCKEDRDRETFVEKQKTAFQLIYEAPQIIREMRNWSSTKETSEKGKKAIYKKREKRSDKLPTGSVWVADLTWLMLPITGVIELFFIRLITVFV